jgi:hypothetical protein
VCVCVVLCVCLGLAPKGDNGGGKALPNESGHNEHCNHDTTKPTSAHRLTWVADLYSAASSASLSSAICFSSCVSRSAAAASRAASADAITSRATRAASAPARSASMTFSARSLCVALWVRLRAASSVSSCSMRWFSFETIRSHASSFRSSSSASSVNVGWTNVCVCVCVGGGGGA